MNETLLWRALNESLRSILAEDDRVFVMGEDLSRWGSGGGIYGVTRGLLAEFGPDRVRETPISEEGILAAAVGAALGGCRPVVEIMYSDFSLLGFDPIVNQAAKIRYMFGGQFDVPLVVRTPTGWAPGKAAQHTQSLDTLFAHIPGLEVVVPSTPDDAYGLLRSAVASPNPTIFLEHKQLYNVRGPLTRSATPLGKANIIRSGQDATVVATQFMVHRSLSVADRMRAEGVELEIVDLRTLYPLDLETVIASARKTRHALVCHEAPLLYGFGGELASAISAACWRDLDAPVQRVGGARAPMPYAAALEKEVIPSEATIEAGIRAVLREGRGEQMSISG
ncbi:MAG TPA: transketolase C-terminal domain-containing protein [bacterium]|nr:transketolase C-terminal domain-containing protein [bacterium]